MLFFKDKGSKKLKLLLISAMLLTLGIIAAVFIGYRQILDQNTDLITTIATKANISIEQFHHTATRNGVKEWILDARTAKVINAEQQAVFEDVSLTFFLEDNTNVHLTANQGILKTDSNDIEVSGNVVVKNKDYRLKTDKLNYTHSKRILYSKVPVKIESNTSQLTANTLSYDLNTSRTVFKGNIKGVFGENINL
jgi:LPS export ABC transporter protein LptC